MTIGSDVVMGVISRFSNSGNAMLQTDDGEELNIGPLPDSAEGERVRAKVIDSWWAVCLDSSYVNEDYLQEMRSRTDLSKQKSQLPITDSSAIVEDVGEIFSVDFNSVGELSVYDGRKPISVNYPEVIKDLDFRDQLPVRILFVRDGIAVAVPAIETLSVDEIASGDAVEVEVEETVSDGEGIVGFESKLGLPVVSTDVVGFKGAKLKLGVEDVLNSHIIVSPSALSEETLPSIGDILSVDIIRSLPDGTVRGLHNGIPTVTPDALGCFGVSEPFEMAVTGYTEHGVAVSVEAVSERRRPDTGDTVKCTVVTPYQDGTFCRVENTPVWISEKVPTPVSSLRLAIQEVNPSHLVGSIIELPEVNDLEIGDSVSVEIQFEDENDGVGFCDGVPVVVPGGRELKGYRAKFGVKEIRNASFVVGVDALNKLPKQGEVVTILDEDRGGGRVCVVDNIPFVLPLGGDWPSGDLRMGVSEVMPKGIKLSVADLPAERRPEEGDEIELSHSDIDPQTSMPILDGIPTQIPQYKWSFHGPIRLGVNQVRSNCVACSVGGLPSVPAPGASATASIDEDTEDGCGGRVDKVPTFLPRMDTMSIDQTEVLIIDIIDDFFVAVETDPDVRDITVDQPIIVAYYRELINAKECWEKDEFQKARDHCREARKLVKKDNDTAELLRLDARRHEIILMGEQIRREHGAEEARETVKEMIESFSELSEPATEFLIDELQAYRFILDGYQSSDSEMGGAVNKGFVNAIVRKMTDASNRNENPWENVIPHPVVSTLLASTSMPSAPSAATVDEILSQTPEYWPFLTLSELT